MSPLLLHLPKPLALYDQLAVHTPKMFIKELLEVKDVALAIELLHHVLVNPRNRLVKLMPRIAVQGKELYIGMVTKYPRDYDWAKHYWMVTEDPLQRGCLEAILPEQPETCLKEGCRMLIKFLKETRTQYIDIPIAFLEIWQKAASIEEASSSVQASLLLQLHSWQQCRLLQVDRMPNLMGIIDIRRGSYTMATVELKRLNLCCEKLLQVTISAP